MLNEVFSLQVGKYRVILARKFRIETQIRELTLELTGKVDETGTPILLEINTHHAEVTVVPLQFKDFIPYDPISILVHNVNAQLMTIDSE